MMQHHGIKARGKRKFVVTTDSKHNLPIAPNLLDRDFVPPAPNRVWTSDGIAFDPDSIAGAPIRKGAGYGGVRIDVRATLDRARLALQIDIGFGDAVTPDAQPVNYPTLLPDVPAPTLRA